MDAKATDSFRDRNLSANYSYGLLRLRLESDWSQNNKHSRNNFRRSWFNAFRCKQRKPWVNCKFGIVAFKQEVEFNLSFLQTGSPHCEAYVFDRKIRYFFFQITTTTTIYLHSHIHQWYCIKKKEKNVRSNYTTMIYKIINNS